MAATQFSNAVAVQQAQQQIGEAHEQAAQDATQSAQQIESSQMNLASVERNAAASQVQALQEVTQAQQGVEQANYGLSEAQYNLSQAWITAKEDLQNLNDQLADSNLNVQAAQLAIQQAIYNQTLVDQNAYSTSLDRQQAALAVAQAQQQLTDAQAQATDAQTAANTANQQGVAGSQTVIQAQQAVTQAQYAQTNAVQQQQDASNNLTLTEQNNAAQIKQAQMEVSQAQEQAAYQQQQNAQNIRIAEQNLTNTIEEQKLEWAATESTENQAANTFLKDMAKLTPAGRSFVNEILGMKGAFKGLETVAQNTVLPGFTIWLKGIQTLIPTLTSGVGKMGTAISNAFGQFGKQMQTASFAKTLQGLMANGTIFANTVLPAVGGFIQGLAKIGSQNGAVSGLANLLGGLFTGLTNITKALSPFVGSLSSVFSTLGQALEPVGTLLGSVVGSLATALAPALKALLPGFNALVGALGKGLSTELQAMAPPLLPIAQAITQVATAASPMIPMLANLVAQFAAGLAPTLQALLPLVGQLADLFITSVQQGFLQTFTAMLPLLPQIANLVISLTPLISTVIRGAGVMMDWAADLNGPILSAMVAVVGGVLNLASHWETAFNDIAKIADWLWHSVLDPVWQGLKSGVKTFVDDFSIIWGGLETVFKTPVNFLIKTVYDNGIARLWNDVVGAIGLGSIKLPIIKALAAGGVVPGWSPGRDNHLAAVSGGEGILTPQATRAVGGSSTIDALNKQYPSSGSTPSSGHAITKMAGKELRRHLTERPAEHILSGGMFAGGGIVGDITGALSGAAHAVGSVVSGALDVGKMVAAVATGNTTAFVNAAAGAIGTSAAGDLGKIMVAIPKTLISDLAKKLTGATAGTSAIGSLPQNWNAIASFLASHGFTKFAAAGVAGNIDAESGGRPEQLEIGGGGGGGLIQWTPYPAGYITGNVSQDLMTQLYGILSFGGGPSMVNQATSPSNAAQIYQDYYEKPANLSASLPQRMASANAVYKAMNWGAFDQGGQLPPGMTMAVNATGKPEAVLTSQQWQTLAALADHLTGRGPAGTAGAGAAQRPIELNFYGQYPTGELKATMMRELALALGGAS